MMSALDAPTKGLLSIMRGDLHLSDDSIRFFEQHPEELPQALPQVFINSYKLLKKHRGQPASIKFTNHPSVGEVAVLTGLKTYGTRIYKAKDIRKVLIEARPSGVEVTPTIHGVHIDVNDLARYLDETDRAELRRSMSSGLEAWASSVSRFLDAAPADPGTTDPEATAGGESPGTLSPEANAGISDLIAERKPAGMLGVTDAAKALGVTRQTIYSWIENGKLIGWPKGTKAGYWIPVEQILGEGRVVPGLPKILDIVADHELTWSFLNQPWPVADEHERPIELLRRDGTKALEDILRAARAFEEGSFL